jgi:hypothetical protein
MKPQPSAAQTPAAGRLDPKEWNFDAVPNTELAACCLWEYARESAFIRDTLRRYREWWKAGGDSQAPGAAEIDRDLSRIEKAIPWQSEVFLRGYGFLGDAPPFTASFPAPWQSLHEGERKARAHLGCEVERLKLVPVRLGLWNYARLIFERCELRAAEPDRAELEWERQYTTPDGERKEGAPDPPAYPPIRPGVFSSHGEQLLLSIAWEHFTNNEIADCFRKVLPALRPHTSPAPKDTGKTRPEIKRAALRDLGVMRLLNVSTVANLKNRCPAAAAYFAQLGWLGTEREKYFSAARKRALLKFRAMFPFLPKAELPLHAPSKGGRAKLFNGHLEGG